MYLDSFTYTHDKVGNRLSKAEPTTTTDYGYDRVYRLLSATPRKPGGERYGYDPVGNRLSGPQAQQAYQYNEGNQLLAKSAEHGKAPNAGIFYTFDNNGNLIGKEERNGSGRAQTVTSYSYDYENRLTGVEIEQGQHRTIVTFSYDPFGRRLSKVVEREANGNGQNGHGCDDRRPAPRVTRYLYDNEDIVLEYDDRGEILARYLHGPGIDEPLAMKRKNALYYYHADGLGSITALNDQNGYVVRKYDYDSFGNMKPEQRQTGQPYTYTAREWDDETGLYYYRARYYDPAIGRFITRDPIGFKGGMNLYSYVQNNPVNFKDAKGLSPAVDPNDPFQRYEPLEETIRKLKDYYRKKARRELVRKCVDKIDYAIWKSIAFKLTLGWTAFSELANPTLLNEGEDEILKHLKERCVDCK